MVVRPPPIVNPGRLPCRSLAFFVLGGVVVLLPAARAALRAIPRDRERREGKKACRPGCLQTQTNEGGIPACLVRPQVPRIRPSAPPRSAASRPNPGSETSF